MNTHEWYDMRTVAEFKADKERTKKAEYLLDRIANREEIEEADVVLARKLLS